MFNDHVDDTSPDGPRATERVDAMTSTMPYGWGRVPFTHADRVPWRNLPFAEEEYEARIARLRALMARDGLDCLLVLGTGADTASVRYLTNFEDYYGGESVVVVPADAPVVFVTNAVMHGEPMHSGIPDAWPHDVRAAAAPRTVTGTARPVTVGDHVRDVLAGLPAGTVIGLVGDWPTQLQQQIGIDGERPDVRRGLGLLRELRAIKSPAEVELLRNAAAIADAAVTAAMTGVRVGATEHDLAAAANEAIFRGGAEHPAFPISLVAGARSGLKHLAPSSYAIAEGDMVFIDVGARYMGYNSDCSRETVCGEPTAEQLRFMNTQAEIVQAVSDRIRPGTVIGEMAALGQSMADDAGYTEWFYFRGHGVGCGLTDLPALAPGNPATFEQGMVFALEPMLVRFGYGTACWEDIWHVTETGLERLNRSTPRFWEATG
jgi:Xaa-Pro aminopeptidase